MSPLATTQSGRTSVKEHVSHNSHLGKDLERMAAEHQPLDDNSVWVHREQRTRGNEVVHSCKAESLMHQDKVPPSAPSTQLPSPNGCSPIAGTTKGASDIRGENALIFSNRMKGTAFSSHTSWTDVLSGVWEGPADVCFPDATSQLTVTSLLKKQH